MQKPKITQEMHDRWTNSLVRSDLPVGVAANILRRMGYGVRVMPTKVATTLDEIADCSDFGDIYIMESAGVGQIPVGSIIEVKQLLAHVRCFNGRDWTSLATWEFVGETYQGKKEKRFFIDSVETFQKKVDANRKPYGYIGINHAMSHYSWVKLADVEHTFSVGNGWCVVRKCVIPTWCIPARLVTQWGKC